jgi:hypothetical protein
MSAIYPGFLVFSCPAHPLLVEGVVLVILIRLVLTDCFHTIWIMEIFLAFPAGPWIRAFDKAIKNEDWIMVMFGVAVVIIALRMHSPSYSVGKQARPVAEEDRNKKHQKEEEAIVTPVEVVETPKGNREEPVEATKRWITPKQIFKRIGAGLFIAFLAFGAWGFIRAAWDWFAKFFGEGW